MTTKSTEQVTTMNAHRPYPAARAAELHVDLLRKQAALYEAAARAAREADATGHAATWEREAADLARRAKLLAAQMAAHEAQPSRDAVAA